MIEPLHLAFEVDCPSEHAFATWTERTSLWWPSRHSVSGNPDLEVVFEGRVGGRIFERTPQGEEFDWGEVTLWDPPRRLAYLWHIRRTRDFATDVLISFRDLDGERTRIEIEHTGWERLGEDGAAWRDANHNGWGALLPHFADACAGSPPVLGS